MFGCGFTARFMKDRYSTLATVAIVVCLVVFGLIITTIILHLTFLWLVLISATIMLFTTFGYSTCSTKRASTQPGQLQQRPSIHSDSISTISDHVTETGITDDFPPCYDVVVRQDCQILADMKPPSYLDALALQRFWSGSVTNTSRFSNSSDSDQYWDASSQLGSFPPPYEEYDERVFASDLDTEMTASLSEDTLSSSYEDTSDCSTLSHISIESLCIEYQDTDDHSEMTSQHMSRGSTSYYETRLPTHPSHILSNTSTC